MRKVANTLTMGAVLLSAVLAYSAAALAGSVTNADLAGKKICWSDGSATYGKDGSFDSNGCGHGTWRLVGDRVEIRSSTCAFDFTISKDNGAFHGVGYGGAGGNYDAWGKYCK